MDGGTAVTLIVVLEVAPNHSTPSWTIFHAKVLLPNPVGAVALIVKVTLEPALMGEDGKFTRLNPQVVLSCGLCEPKRCGCEPPLVQAVVPVFFILTVAVKLAPAWTELG